LSDELPADLRPIVDFFGLPNTAVVAKDFHVVRAVRALASLDATPFALIFGGGTALARAHKLMRRMSEDVDFKMVPLAPTPLSRSALQRQLSLLRERVSTALLAAGFVFDPQDRTHTWARNEYRYNVYHLPYGALGTALRPTIQVELTYATLRRPAVTCAFGSLIAEALGRSPEVPAIPCVSVTETAAEKLVALTRRLAMELAGLSRNPDPTLVRHIYDVHLMQAHCDPAEVAALARDIAVADAADHAPRQGMEKPCGATWEKNHIIHLTSLTGGEVLTNVVKIDLCKSKSFVGRATPSNPGIRKKYCNLC
jgi:predicted nucleotidyltransferase component of viral defense system